MRKSLVLYVAGLFLFPIVVFAQLVAPSVYVIELQLPSVTFQSGGVIQGVFLAKNAEAYSISDIQYTINLRKKAADSQFDEGDLVDQVINPEIFSILPGETLAKKFIYKLPINLPGGQYNFGIELITARGIPLSWKNAIINTEGGGILLELTNEAVIKDGVSYRAGLGLSFDSDEEVLAEFRALNPSDRLVAVVPHLKIFRRHNNLDLIQEYDEASISFAANEIKNLKYVLPKLTIPESYLAELVFMDNAGNPVSNRVFFRWVIAGPGAEVLALSAVAPKDGGLIYTVAITYSGPADIGAKSGNGNLLIKAVDNGIVIGQVSVLATLGPGVTKNEVVNIPLDYYVENPQIVAEIVQEDKVLDSYSINQPPAARKSTAVLLLAAIIIIIFLALVVTVFKILKKKKASATTFLVMVIFGGALAVTIPRVASADLVTEVLTDTEGAGIAFNSPRHGDPIQSGNQINFEGKIWIPGCFNGLVQNSIEFYLTDKIGQKRYDFGKFTLPDSDQPYVYYNFTFNVPDNLIFEPARAYVVFAGRHAANTKFLHTVRAYEHLLASPDNLSAFCSADGKTAKISWDAVPEAYYYYLRVNNLADGWDGSCSSAGGDFCQNISSTSHSFSSLLSNSYDWWVHSCNAVGCGGSAIGPRFICETRLPQCSDGIDNDGDGLNDYPGDPSCSSVRDDNENISFIIDFNASPSVINRGGTAILNWTTSGFNSCVIDQGIGAVEVNGSKPASPSQTTIYTITCLSGPNSTNPVSRQATVQIRVSGLKEVVP